MTYSIASGVLLLSSDNKTLALSGIQSALALDDSLTGSSAASTVLASNAGSRVPIIHFEGV